MNKFTPPKRTEQLIDAISSLKRASFIESHERASDGCSGGVCRIWTQSEASAEILANLLHRSFVKGPILKDWHEGGGQKPPKAVEIQRYEADRWLVTFPVSEHTCKLITDNIKNLTKSLIAPDRGRTNIF